jgi:[ribosomal protein S5]-alanine N-acetyltransferase
MMQPAFTTERLQLNLIDDADGDFIFQLVNTDGWLQFIGDRKVKSLDDATAYITRIKNTPDLFYWVARLKTDQTPIGIISFLKRGYLDHFDLGFAFLPQFNGQGYAYEASSEVLNVAKGLHQVILATTVPANTRSISLLQRLGFGFEKEMVVDREVLHVYSHGKV